MGKGYNPSFYNFYDLKKNENENAAKNSKEGGSKEEKRDKKKTTDATILNCGHVLYTHIYIHNTIPPIHAIYLHACIHTYTYIHSLYINPLYLHAHALYIRA